MFGVLAVEDKDVIARQLARCVSQNRWLSLAGVAATEQEAVDLARRVRPGLVLLDFGLSTPWPDSTSGTSRTRSTRCLT